MSYRVILRSSQCSAHPPKTPDMHTRRIDSELCRWNHRIQSHEETVQGSDAHEVFRASAMHGPGDNFHPAGNTVTSPIQICSG